MSSSQWSSRTNQVRALSDRTRILVKGLLIAVSATAAVCLSVIAFAIQP
jgi:hypothetical protein